MMETDAQLRQRLDELDELLHAADTAAERAHYRRQLDAGLRLLLGEDY